MAKCDMATDEEEANFADKKARILSSVSTWDVKSKKYLEAVLDGLEMMTAYYSYGNGEINIENSSTWNTLEPEVIVTMINRVIKPNLNIEVSEIYNKFPTTLWFEMEVLIDNSDENGE
jgi:Ni,Fe-hydrogenase III component G